MTNFRCSLRTRRPERAGRSLLGVSAASKTRHPARCHSSRKQQTQRTAVEVLILNRTGRVPYGDTLIAVIDVILRHRKVLFRCQAPDGFCPKMSFTSMRAGSRWTAAACCRFDARSLLRDFGTGFGDGVPVLPVFQISKHSSRITKGEGRPSGAQLLPFFRSR